MRIMLTMLNIEKDTCEILNILGQRLKDARLSLNESQEVFAEKQNLFEQYEQSQQKRKRASGKRARSEKVEKGNN